MHDNHVVEPTDNATGEQSAGGGAAHEGEALSDDRRLSQLEQEGEFAADYLEGFLDILDADGDIDMAVEGDRAMVSIVGSDLRQLIGRGGTVLDALQELTRIAVARRTGVRSRLILDIAGYRARRRKEIAETAREAVARVQETGQPVRLQPMTAYERKIVHDVVAAAGLRSESEGTEPDRRVVVYPTEIDGVTLVDDPYL